MAGVAVAVSARMGGRPSTLAARRRPRYAGRKSWPHCDTQWASSTANSENFTPSRAACTDGRANRLGRDDDELDGARAYGLEVGGPLLGRAGRIDARHRHPGRLQLADLILNEREQGRHDQRRARQDQRRQLVGQRLAAARRHDGQGVATRQHRLEDLGLTGAQSAHLEHLLQLAQSNLQGRRGRRGRVPRSRDHHGAGGRRSTTARRRGAATLVGLLGARMTTGGDAVVRDPRLPRWMRPAVRANGGR